MNDAVAEMSASASQRWLPHVAPNGEVARVLLSFLATAGLFYVNIMPALVDGLIDGLGFTNQQAGFVGSANVYGAALGAFSVVFVIRRINWKTAAVGLLIGMILCDVVSLYITDPYVLIVMRFFHGTVGGFLVGIGFAVISRTTQVDRTFGYLLTIQFGLGGLGLMYLPPLVPVYGTSVLFLALSAFSLVTLLMLPFLSDYPIREEAVKIPGQGKTHSYKLLGLALLATFLFQAANMGVYAYVIGVARHAGLEMDFISSTLGVAAWIAIIGSVLVIIMSTRFGRLYPVLAATFLTAVGTWVLHYSETPSMYWIANVGVGITWAFVISYLLGLCAEFDVSGQMAALGGFASKMGLASGPLAAAFLVGDNDYGSLITIASVLLILSMLAVIPPALALDKKVK